MTPLSKPQVTDSVLLVQPFLFGINKENEKTNAFIREPSLVSGTVLHQKAIEEFHAVHQEILSIGANVHVVRESRFTSMDSIFPNNWFSTHSNSSFITYPMLSEARRKERTPEVIEYLRSRYAHHIQLERIENQGLFLEGTGSLVLDRINNVAYACLSERTHMKALNLFERQTGFNLICFRGSDKLDRPIYHTNVLMSIGSELSIICLEAIKNPGERDKVESSLIDNGRTIVEISIDQMCSFAANCLEIKGKNDESYLVMSKSALDSLRQAQLDQIQSLLKIKAVPIPFIEMASGGSLRCMIAELF